jgi:hypothetical protein
MWLCGRITVQQEHAQRLAGVGLSLTVEEGRPVDAGAWLCAGEIPHLMKGPALADGDYKTDEEEHRVQDDGAATQDTEGP